MDFKRFVRAEWDRIAGYGFLLAGFVALIFGFVGVRNAADVIDEISYLVTGGIGAIFLLGVGATLLLSADLHDDFRKLHRVEEKLDAIHRALAAEHPELVDLLSDPPGGPGVLAVRRGRRLAVVGALIAAALFLAGAVATANQAGTDHLAGGIGVALSGALLAAITAGVLVGQLKGLLEQRKAVALGPWLTEATAAVAPAATEAQVWVVDGLRLYHRAGCRALEGRPAEARDRSALAAGARPCGLCEPQPGR
jgi:hypothetical protein